MDFKRWARGSVGVVLAAALLACGGGGSGGEGGAGVGTGAGAGAGTGGSGTGTGSGTDTGAPSGGASAPSVPQTQSVSGIVIDGPIKGATVCVDLNRNGACDAGEPASAPTDALGKYTISGLTADQLAQAAPFVAMVPASAVDASNPSATVGTPYVMSAPAGKGDVISPVTTLVQAGTAQGLTRTAAEAAVAAQLQVAVGSLYNDYTASTSTDNASLMALVPSIVGSLQGGEPLVVSAPTAGSASYWVRQFTLYSGGVVYTRIFFSDNVPNAAGLYTFFDERTMLSSTGVAANGYGNYLFETETGWVPLNGATAHQTAGGSPFVWNYAGYKYISTRTEIDVSGQSLASVAATAQDLTINSVNTLNGVNVANLAGTMPAGAKIRKITSAMISTPVNYSADNGYVANASTVAGLAAAYPVPSVSASATNTVDMGNLHVVCSLAPCLQEQVRAAFGSGNVATIYLCDVLTANQPSNCGVIGTGSYSLGKAKDGVTPVMRFAGLPASTKVASYERVFVERDGHVYFGQQDKPARSVATQLNREAFEPIAAAIGVAAPMMSASVSPFVGNWNLVYTGADSGTCSNVVYATGYLFGDCMSASTGRPFSLSGSVTPDGLSTFAAFDYVDGTTPFSGTFSSNAGSGTWTRSSQRKTGSWMSVPSGTPFAPDPTPITVTYDIAQFNILMAEGADVSAVVNVRLSPVPSGPVYVRIVADGPVLKADGTTFTGSAASGYSALVGLGLSLPVGTYTGTLALRLCKDPQCTVQYTLRGASLPYWIKVVPRINVSVAVNGLPGVLVNDAFYSVRVGDVVTLTSDIPASWNLRTGPLTTSALSVTSSTAGNWTATVLGPSRTGFALDAASTQLSSNLKQLVFSVQ